jgi:hypothetical protein
MIAFLLTLLLTVLSHGGLAYHPADSGGGTPILGLGTMQASDSGGGTPI